MTSKDLSSKNNFECPICNIVSDEENQIKITECTGCGNKLCIDCLNTWGIRLKKPCPFCSKKDWIKEENIPPQNDNLIVVETPHSDQLRVRYIGSSRIDRRIEREYSTDSVFIDINNFCYKCFKYILAIYVLMFLGFIYSLIDGTYWELSHVPMWGKMLLFIVKGGLVALFLMIIFLLFTICVIACFRIANGSD